MRGRLTVAEIREQLDLLRLIRKDVDADREALTDDPFNRAVQARSIEQTQAMIHGLATALLDLFEELDVDRPARQGEPAAVLSPPLRWFRRRAS